MKKGPYFFHFTWLCTLPLVFSNGQVDISACPALSQLSPVLVHHKIQRRTWLLWPGNRRLRRPKYGMFRVICVGFELYVTVSSYRSNETHPFHIHFAIGPEVCFQGFQLIPIVEAQFHSLKGLGSLEVWRGWVALGTVDTNSHRIGVHRS